MGRGRSPLSGGARGGASGSLQSFRGMTEDEQVTAIDAAINNTKTPKYLDDTPLKKFLYGEKLAAKPNLVSEDELDAMPGEDRYRVIYDSVTGGISSEDIYEQFTQGDYMRLSGPNTSYHGHAYYFGDDYGKLAAWYAQDGKHSMAMRMKFSPNAKGIMERDLMDMMNNDSSRLARLCKNYNRNSSGRVTRENTSGLGLYALAKGYDYYDDGRGYLMILNRGALNISRTAKRVGDGNSATSWRSNSDAVTH